MTASSWWQLLPAVLVAACFLWLPGFVIGLGWRLRLLAACCLAPLLSLFVIGSSALAAHFTGQRWGVAWVLIVACAIATAGLWRWRRGRHEWAQTLRHQAAVLAGYLVGTAMAVAVLGRRLIWALGNPGTIAQRYDNAFHLNASVYVYLTGHASGLDVGRLLGLGFYPASFHDAVALVMSTTGLWVAPAVHAVILFAIFVMWPLSLVLMLEPFFKMNWVGRLALGPLSLGLNMFPYVLMDWGLVYPNILALSVAPALVALGFFCLGKGDRNILTGPDAVLLIVPAVVGAGLTHPNSVFLMVAGCAPLAVFSGFRLLRGSGSEEIDRFVSRAGHGSHPRVLGRLLSGVMGTALLIVVLLILPILWRHASLALQADSSPWKPFQSTAQAVGEVLLGTGMGRPHFPLGVLVAVGVVWLVLHWRGRLWWAIGAVLLASFYVASSSLPQSTLRTVLAGVFYTDSYRTSAYASVVAVPLAVLGAQWVWNGAREAVLRLRSSWNWSRLLKWIELGLAICIAAGFCAGTAKNFSYWERLNQIGKAYIYYPDSSILSANELKLLEEIKQVTSPNDIIVVDPWTGAGLVYALAQRMPTQFYMFSPVDADVSLVTQRLKYATDDPQVCAAVHRLGATYVLTLDPRRIADTPLTSEYEGLINLGSQPGFEPVVSVGQDTLYRITACG